MNEGPNSALLRGLFDDISANRNAKDKATQEALYLRAASVGLQVLSLFLDNVGRIADALETVAANTSIVDVSGKDDERDIIGIKA